MEEARTACGKGIRDIAEREASAVEVLRRDFDERVAVTLRTIETSVQNTIQTSKVELQGLEGEKARLEELLAPARWLFWTLESQDYANSLPLSIVSRVADRLAH
jgi:hypothetical protein